MAQKLVLPINDCAINSGYKNANYRKQFGYMHYGWDLADYKRKDLTVWGCGTGVVKATGYDNVLGNVVVIVYKNCLLTNGIVRDLTQRIYHLDTIYVKVGQRITKDTRIAKYGNTGKYSTGDHLHIEFDTDTNDKYVCWSPTVSKSGNIIKAGTDSTINPNLCLYVKRSAPDYQNFRGRGYDTVAQSDLALYTY